MLGTNFPMHNKRLLPLFALILMLVLAACGGSDSATPAVPAEEQMPETIGEPVGALSVAPGGTLRVATQPIVNTDPIAISSDSEVLVANHVYDYLVDIDGASNVVPRLAESWDISADGLTYTFQLADGVTFHDGSPFTAADVVWTFDRLRNPAGTAHGRSLRQHRRASSHRRQRRHLHPGRSPTPSSSMTSATTTP